MNPTSRPSSRTMARLGASAVIACLALGACGTNDEATTDQQQYEVPELGQVPIVTSDVTLPFDEYELAYPDRVATQRDEARLLDACMDARGASTEFAGDYLRPASGPVIWGGPFGTMSADHAERFGYKAGPDDVFSLGPGFYVRLVSNIGPTSGEEDVQAAFFGSETSQSGCLNEVEDQIDADVVDIADVAADVINLATNDSRVLDAMSQWTRCMSEAGYEFATVTGAAETYGLSDLSPQETEVASQDVECTAQSGWANIYYAVLADYQRQAIDKNERLFETYLASQQERLDRVGSLVAELG